MPDSREPPADLVTKGIPDFGAMARTTWLACGGARLVESERRGRNVCYRVYTRRLRELLDHVGELADESHEHLASSGRIGPGWI